jgi:5-hydroxyisourate hydrolase-like protein (transthyretin family)
VLLFVVVARDYEYAMRFMIPDYYGSTKYAAQKSPLLTQTIVLRIYQFGVQVYLTPVLLNPTANVLPDHIELAH